MKTKEKIFTVYNMIRFYGISYYIPRWIKDFYYDKIKPIFKPCHERHRKVIPRTWCDLTELIVISNLEFIKGFYEEEYSSGWVDWDATPDHKKFSKWLEKAYKYATEDRAKLEKDIENAYPPIGDIGKLFERKIENGLVTTHIPSKAHAKIEYQKKYGKVDRLEAKLKDLDSKYIKEMIDYREYFWT